MTTKPERLYGAPGAEYLHLEIMGAYESQIDPYVPDDWEDTWQTAEKTIEEWTVQPASNQVPSTVAILDHVVEVIADEAVLEEFYDECVKAADQPDVVEAFEKARSVLCSKIGFFMADKHVATHKVTWSDPNTPLIDGKPLYRETEVVDWCSTHDRKMRGVRGNGNWACEAVYEPPGVTGGCVRVDRRRAVEARECSRCGESVLKSDQHACPSNAEEE